jgi:hypothetical protein
MHFASTLERHRNIFISQESTFIITFRVCSLSDTHCRGEIFGKIQNSHKREMQPINCIHFKNVPNTNFRLKILYFTARRWRIREGGVEIKIGSI